MRVRDFLESSRIYFLKRNNIIREAASVFGEKSLLYSLFSAINFISLHINIKMSISFLY